MHKMRIVLGLAAGALFVATAAGCAGRTESTSAETLDYSFALNSPTMGTGDLVGAQVYTRQNPGVAIAPRIAPPMDLANLPSD